MEQGTHLQLSHSWANPVFGRTRPRLLLHKAELALGLVAATAASLFVSVHWTLGLFATVAVLALSAAESEWFLLFVIALLPFNWILPTVPLVHDVMLAVRALVIVGFFLGRFWRSQLDLKTLFQASLTKTAVVIFIVAVVSVASSSGWNHYSSRELFRLATYLGFYLLILSWANSLERLQRICTLLLASTIFVCLFALLQQAVGGYTSLWLYFNPADDFFIPWDGRAPSFLAYCNTLAGYLNLILPVSLACLVLGTRKWRRLGYWTVGLGFLGILCTQSLGGLISLVALIVLAILCFAGTRRKKVALLAGTCLLLVGYVLARRTLNPAHAADPEATAIGSGAGRLVMWGAAWDLFLHSPVVGVGWGNFINIYEADLRSVQWMPAQIQYVNNLYLDILCGTGLLGAASFSVFTFVGLRQARRAFLCRSGFSRILGFGVLGGITTSLIHGLVDDAVVVSSQVGTLFWVLLALLVANNALETQKSAGVADFRGGRTGFTNL